MKKRCEVGLESGKALNELASVRGAGEKPLRQGQALKGTKRHRLRSFNELSLQKEQARRLCYSRLSHKSVPGGSKNAYDAVILASGRGNGRSFYGRIAIARMSNRQEYMSTRLPKQEENKRCVRRSSVRNSCVF